MQESCLIETPSFSLFSYLFLFFNSSSYYLELLAFVTKHICFIIKPHFLSCKNVTRLFLAPHKKRGKNQCCHNFHHRAFEDKIQVLSTGLHPFGPSNITVNTSPSPFASVPIDLSFSEQWFAWFSKLSLSGRGEGRRFASQTFIKKVVHQKPKSKRFDPPIPIPYRRSPGPYRIGYPR